MLFYFYKNGIIIVKKKGSGELSFLFLKKGVADAQEQSFNNNIKESKTTVKIHE